MRHPNFILLYVANVADSTHFYQQLLHCAPIEASPGFAMFALDSGLMLGLWARQQVEPSANGNPGASEIAIAVQQAQDVSALHASWTSQSVSIAQPPSTMDFGFTFVALDPDGHRIRVFAPN